LKNLVYPGIVFAEPYNVPVGSKAWFVSPTFDASSTQPAAQCLTFWYHMLGKHIGAVNVYVAQDLQVSVRDIQIWSNLTLQQQSLQQKCF